MDSVRACKPKCRWFNSQAGHMLGLQAMSSGEGGQEATTHWCFTSPLSLSLPLSLKINKISKKFTYLFFIDWFLEREDKGRREGKEGVKEIEREASSCCCIYLCIHWLLLVCALTGDWTCNIGVSGWYSNYLSYLARAKRVYFLKICSSLHAYKLIHYFADHLLQFYTLSSIHSRHTGLLVIPQIY